MPLTGSAMRKRRGKGELGLVGMTLSIDEEGVARSVRSQQSSLLSLMVLKEEEGSPL